MDNKKSEIVKIIDQISSDYSNQLNDVAKSSYKEGFSQGFNKGFELGSTDANISNIDWDSIKLFAKFCYINGIDFSYMSKGTDTVPFTDRVINKFKIELEEKDYMKSEDLSDRLITFEDVYTCKPKLKLGELIQLFLLGDDDKIYISLYKDMSNTLNKKTNIKYISREPIVFGTRIISEDLISYYNREISYIEESSNNDAILNVIIK